MNAEYVTETLSANLSDRLAACRAEVAGLQHRLRVTAQILVESIGANGPANSEHLARIAAAEVARLRAENDRYRAALVDIAEHKSALNKIFPSQRDFHVHFRDLFSAAQESALHALAIRRTESGPLSDDSGPIARDGK